MSMAQVVGIYICADKALPMRSRKGVVAIKGEGLRGDRYALARGSYSKGVLKPKRSVSLIAVEAINKANERAPHPFGPRETRRNIVTCGIELNALVGKTIRIGKEVTIEVMELAHPCNHPSDLSGKPGFKIAFAGCGGVRGDILIGGTLFLNDTITVL